MPPRKRQRLSSAAPSIQTPAASSPPSQINESPAPSYTTAVEPISPSSTPTTSGYWDNIALTALFKSLIFHKPTGPHKHFQMLVVAKELSSSLGYHIPIPSIWAKLEEMYLLHALDEKETAHAFARQDGKGIGQAEFSLPGLPISHGPALEENVEEEEENEESLYERRAADEKAIEELWLPKNEDQEFFMEVIWKRRWDGRDAEEAWWNGEDEEVEASPVPSTVKSDSRKAKSVRTTTRASGRRASIISQTPALDEAEDEEQVDGDDEEKPAARSTRRSVRGKK